MTNEIAALRAAAEAATLPCGPCDSGLPMGCNCIDDPRPLIARLLLAIEAVEAIRVDMDRRAAITSSRYVRCKDVANALRYALEDLS